MGGDCDKIILFEFSCIFILNSTLKETFCLIQDLGNAIIRVC